MDLNTLRERLELSTFHFPLSTFHFPLSTIHSGGDNGQSSSQTFYAWLHASFATGSLRDRIVKLKISHVARPPIQKGCSDYSVRVVLPPPSPDLESGRSPASRVSECNFRSRSSAQMSIFGCCPNFLG